MLKILAAIFVVAVLYYLYTQKKAADPLSPVNPTPVNPTPVNPTPVPAPTPTPTPANPVVTEDIDGVCKLVPTCEKVDQVDMNNWNVKCKGQTDNTLHKNSPSEWIWMKGYNDATFARHPTPNAAIQAACPPFDIPACAGIESCVSVSQTGPKDWEVKCKGQTDNTLHMNSPSEWIWMKGYNDATFARHPNPVAAIRAACPPFVAATDDGVCSPTRNNCAAVMDVNIAGYGPNQTAVKCVGDSDYTNTLLGSPGHWLFYKGYNAATFAKYPDVPSAIQAYCSTTPRAGTYNR